MESGKALVLAGLLFVASAGLGFLAMTMDTSEDVDKSSQNGLSEDPLIQGEEHDHRDPAQHNMSSSNIEFADFNELTSPGNAEVQVMTAPDGRVYALSLIHI